MGKNHILQRVINKKYYKSDRIIMIFQTRLMTQRITSCARWTPLATLRWGWSARKPFSQSYEDMLCKFVDKCWQKFNENTNEIKIFIFHQPYWQVQGHDPHTIEYGVVCIAYLERIPSTSSLVVSLIKLRANNIRINTLPHITLLSPPPPFPPFPP